MNQHPRTMRMKNVFLTLALLAICNAGADAQSMREIMNGSAKLTWIGTVESFSVR